MSLLRISLLGFWLVCLTAAVAWSAPATKLTVTAELIEIPTAFPDDRLYDYAYVMKYRVKGGERDGQILLVAHYKPKKQRRQIADLMKAHVKGRLKRFRVGDVHKLELDPDLHKIWTGTLVDDYWATDRKRTRYWCLRADPA